MFKIKTLIQKFKFKCNTCGKHFEGSVGDVCPYCKSFDVSIEV